MLQHKTVICREGLFYLLVLAFVAFGSILRDVNLLMVIAGMMLFPFLLNWRAAVVSLRGLTVERQLPKSITAGDLLVVTIAIKNRGRRFFRGKRASWAVKLDDSIRNESTPATTPAKTVGLIFWRIAADHSVQLSYSARLYQRGIYCIGPALLSTGFPLGLIRHSRLCKQSDRVIVFPRCGNLTPHWIRIFQATGSIKTSKFGMSDRPLGDFHGLRDWRTGDGRRLIHWRSTARRGVPVVRQFDQQRRQDLHLLVDLWEDGTASETAEEILENTLSFAATIVTELCRRGSAHLRLTIHGGEATQHTAVATMRILPQFLTLLATATPCRQDRLTELVSELHEPAPAAMSTLILSRRPLEPDELTAACGRSGERGLALKSLTCIHTAGEELQQFFEPPT